jgi:glycosyltransferase involved in cell wall biosynthesis
VNFLFVHNNFPGQFVHLAPALAARGHRVSAIGAAHAPGLANVPMKKYRPPNAKAADLKHVRRFQTHVQGGLGAAAAARAFADEGLKPDLIFGHIGWGETLFLKEVWPDVRVALYAEFYYSGRGLDVGFDPSLEPHSLETDMLVRARTAGLALAMAHADFALAPTEFQRAVFPPAFRERIVVQHDGVDCSQTRPRDDARFALPSGEVLTRGDEVVTYVNRHLEPMRGVHVFLRSLPRLLKARPKAHVVIIGSDGGRPYGPSAGEGMTWAKKLRDELGDALDPARVHFVGSAPRAQFLDALCVSKAHVYLTYPFVLSWSLIDAMASACPIIASDTSPVREVIRHGENGVLVDFFNTDAMADAVAGALAAPERMAPLRTQARADALARFDLKSVCLPRLVALAEGWAAGV